MFFEIMFDAPLPHSLSLILGDAIHNLRTALDHAAWELLGLDNAAGGTSALASFSNFAAVKRLLNPRTSR